MNYNLIFPFKLFYSADQNRILCTEHESLVRHIIELGFSRAEVEAALCASYNNPDRAVEYLINVSNNILVCIH